MQLPAHLYKYESLSAQTLTNLKGQILYFGSPLGFNDPYDCALTPNIRSPTDDEIESIRQSYLNDPKTPAPAREQFTRSSIAALRKILVESGRSALHQAISAFLQNRGVTCFSERNDDLLMWSHYGGRYRGLCLEFSTASEAFSKIRPVRYVDSIPSIELAPLLLGNDFDPVSELFCIKSSAWSYEKEWRAIHAVAGTQFTYLSEALTGVYFGPDIDTKSMEIVCLVLSGQNERVRFWRGRRSTTEFKVLFEEFTYTSYLEAKRKGLL